MHNFRHIQNDKNYSPVIHVVPCVMKQSIGHWLTAISLEILTHKLQMNSLDTAWLHVTTNYVLSAARTATYLFILLLHFTIILINSLHMWQT